MMVVVKIMWFRSGGIGTAVHIIMEYTMTAVTTNVILTNINLIWLFSVATWWNVKIKMKIKLRFQQILENFNALLYAFTCDTIF